MRLLTFAVDGRVLLGLKIGDYVVDLAAGFAVAETQGPSGLQAPPADMRSFLEAGDQAMQAAAFVGALVDASLAGGRKGVFASQPGVLHELKNVRVLPPIANPHKMMFPRLAVS